MYIDNVRIAYKPDSNEVYLVKQDKNNKITQKRKLTSYELTQMSIFFRDILECYREE